MYSMTTRSVAIFAAAAITYVGCAQDEQTPSPEPAATTVTRAPDAIFADAMAALCDPSIGDALRDASMGGSPTTHKLYALRDFAPRFEHADLFIDELARRAVRESIDPERLLLPRLRDAWSARSARTQDACATDNWSDRAREELAAYLKTPSATEDVEDPQAWLARVESTTLDLPNMGRALRDAAAQTHALRDAAVALELAATHSAIAYARIARADNIAWGRSVTWPEALAEPTQEQLEGMSRREKRRAASQREAARKVHLRSVVLEPMFAPGADVVTALEALQPPFAQYTRLQDALARYTEIVQRGGWQSLPRAAMALEPGGVASRASKALRVRLEAEGYLPEESRGGGLDRHLVAALKTYQETHQIKPSGEVTKETFKSLNKSAEARRAQIELALKRWRDSAVGADPFYVHVNVADFHAEVWDGEARKTRMKVVTGSRKQVWDKDEKELVRPHATPLFSETMKHIVFNPAWMVPRDIVQNELIPKLRRDRKYFEKHNYTWVDKKRQRVQQGPGPTNALGRVKFLFPNPHNVYMHDTPEQHKFSYPVRAFSHGCVRLSEPMEMARVLLEREGRWNERSVEHWLKGKGAVWVKLEQPVPVHIESIGARVDDLGRIHFLTDVYKRDIAPMTAMSASRSAHDLTRKSRAVARAFAPPAEVAVAER